MKAYSFLFVVLACSSIAADSIKLEFSPRSITTNLPYKTMAWTGDRQDVPVKVVGIPREFDGKLSVSPKEFLEALSLEQKTNDHCNVSDVTITLYSGASYFRLIYGVELTIAVEAQASGRIVYIGRSTFVAKRDRDYLLSGEGKAEIRKSVLIAVSRLIREPASAGGIITGVQNRSEKTGAARE